MPKIKKTKPDRWKEYYAEVDKYRWEFLRRSLRYKEAYKAILPRRQSFITNNQNFLKDGLLFANKSLQEEYCLKNIYSNSDDYKIEKDFLREFEIILPFMPSPMDEYSVLILKREINPNKAKGVFFDRRGKVIGIKVTGKPFDVSSVNIEINFDLINSPANLKKFLNDTIDEYYRIREKCNIQKGQTYSNHAWEEILIIGDKYLNGATEESIASEMIPSQYRKNPSAAVKQISEKVIFYKELIDGQGHKRITFP